MKQDIKVLTENKSKFLLVHSSSGHKQALREVLSDPAVTTKLADTKVRPLGVGVWLHNECCPVMMSRQLGR